MAKQAITYEQVMAALQRKEYKPVYMLTGEEPYYIDKIADYIEQNVLTEDEKAFNLTVAYGKDVDLREILMAAKRFPMMSQYQVIIVKEAQHIKNYDDLTFYLQQPQLSTILVFCHKVYDKNQKLDGRKKSTAAMAAKGLLFESTKLYDNQVAGWIEAYGRSKGIGIDVKTSNMLAEFLGTDLSRIVSELDKLMIVLGNSDDKRITPDLVEKNIGISKDFNVFELLNALAEHNIGKSNRIIDYFGKNPKNNPIVVTISQLFNFFQNLLLYHSLRDKSQMNAAAELKIKPFFVQRYQQAARSYNSGKTLQILSDIRRADAQSKGFGSANLDDTEILKELIFRILH